MPMKWDPTTRTYTPDGRPGIRRTTPRRSDMTDFDRFDRSVGRTMKFAGCLSVFYLLFICSAVTALIVLAWKVWG